MGKNKRKTPMSERGIVVSWKQSDDGSNKGFGFIERENGRERIFCHKNQIQDGTALKIGTEVMFDARADPKPGKPDNMMAGNVRGGVCYNHVYGKHGCEHGKRCKFSHADRAVVREPPPPPLSIDAAAAAVASQRRNGPPPVLVDTIEACREHCARLTASGVVAVDFEGANLCRDGELYLAQLAAVDGPVVLVDVVRLKQTAFDEGGLKALLESEDVLKLIFDGRADSDALYHLHQTRLTNVYDLQVLCARHLDQATGSSSRGGTAICGGGKSGSGGDGGGGSGGARRVSGPSAGRLPGLGLALSSCPSLQGAHGAALSALKKACHSIFVPELGGSYEVWKERPLPTAILEYAAADVAHLHSMRDAWGSAVGAEEMREITSRRIGNAISGERASKGPHMAERDF